MGARAGGLSCSSFEDLTPYPQDRPAVLLHSLGTLVWCKKSEIEDGAVVVEVFESVLTCLITTHTDPSWSACSLVYDSRYYYCMFSTKEHTSYQHH